MRLFPTLPQRRDGTSQWRTRDVLGALAVMSLSLASMADAASKNAADYFVRELPGAPEGVPLLKMHAGHIPVNPEHNGHLFFWRFANRHLADKPRTVIWLNGGPGCSSEDGALMEIGPYRVREGGQLALQNGSWDEFANVVFVDQPVGTGFSYADTNRYVHELDEMARQFVVFLDEYYKLFPETLGDDLYLTGESYAGQYIPYIAKAILTYNKENPAHPMNLQGLIIGNGWIDPPAQYTSSLQYAYKTGLITPGSDADKRVQAQQSICLKDLASGGGRRIDSISCEQVLQEILRVTQSNDRDKPCVNMYDVRLRDSYPSCGMNWPPDLVHVTPYLRREDVKRALHVDPAKRAGWTECNGAVSGAFTARNSPPSVQLLPELLAQMPVLLFSGDQDLICNHIGTEDLIHGLEFNGGKGFEISPGTWAPRRQWTFEGEAAGLYQEARNLTYVLFYNSSHMVPFDYPRRSRDMLDRFMGVDIASIGGAPADSKLDGSAAGPPTSVGETSGSTQAQAEAAARLKAAERKAYMRSGGVALAVVLVAAVAVGFFVWRARRAEKRRRGVGESTQKYMPVAAGEEGNGHAAGGRSAGLEGYRERDLEAGELDENELDDLEAPVGGQAAGKKERRYSEGGESSEEGSRAGGTTGKSG